VQRGSLPQPEPRHLRLTQALVAHDVVDELRLRMYPLLLGTGKRLFAETSDLRRLSLTEIELFGDGVLLLVYALNR
jgi:riboflavin biosynthesis pyrimidine reductase